MGIGKLIISIILIIGGLSLLIRGFSCCPVKYSVILTMFGAPMFLIGLDIFHEHLEDIYGKKRK